MERHGKQKEKGKKQRNGRKDKGEVDKMKKTNT